MDIGGPFDPAARTSGANAPTKPLNTTERLEKVLGELSRPIAFIGVLGMLIVAGVTMDDDLARWLVSGGVPALTEIVSMTFAVAVAACIPCGLAQRVSLKIDLFENAIKGNWRLAIDVLGDVLLAVFFALLTVGIYIYAGSLASGGRTTVILALPQAPFIYATAALLAVAVVVQAVISLNTIRRLFERWDWRRGGPETVLSLRVFAVSIGLVVAALAVVGFLDVSLLVDFAKTNPGTTVAIACVLLWSLLMLLLPLAAVMGLIGIVATALFIGFAPAYSAFTSEATGFLTNSQIAVLPLFLMMGSFCAIAGMAEDVYAAAHALLAQRRGGLAMATIGGCAWFGAVTGSTVATAATIGRVALPEMKARGYSPSLSLGCVAAGGTLGNLVPPGSAPLVLFALLTEASIGQLFIGSVIPALLAILAYLVTVAIYTRVAPNSAPPIEARIPGEFRRAARRCGPVTALFVIVLGGLFTGVFTATESAAVGAFGAFLIALLRGKLRARSFWSVVAETTSTTALIYSLVFGALIFAFFTGVSGLTESASKSIVGLGWEPLAVVALLLVVFLVLGTFMDSYAIMIITIPIVTPLIISAGYDLVWWGILNLFVIEIGGISPPFGLTMFVLKSVGDAPMSAIFKGVTPFCIAGIVVLAILVLFPQLVLWLPSMMIPG
ncbi:MAG: TRAP transporter large permease subunit [Xanthobacteraceae bacterium]